jgi:dTDP-4-amino-4,6-dideoxygalactose transaminase
VEAFADLVGTSRILLTPSCTAALEMSALLLDLNHGDEVIVPSFTFVSTANAFVLMGAKVVFADIDPVTLNLDPASTKDRVTERTKAIVPVHYGGTPCDMASLILLAEQAGATVVEDAAHGLFASHKGTPLGRFGALATFSFHETKNLSTGEGGALVVNDESLWERAQVLREKGTDRTIFMLGLVDKYTWVDTGSSYLMADPLAAVLLAQIEFSAETQRRRLDTVIAYRAHLADWAAEQAVILPPEVAAGDTEAGHMFPLLFDSKLTRDRFIDHCRGLGVQSVFHYLPLHDSPMGRRLGASPAECPVTSDVSARLARLPVFSDITVDERDRVLDVVVKFES